MISSTKAYLLIRDQAYRDGVVAFGQSPKPEDPRLHQQHEAAREIAEAYAPMADWDVLTTIRNQGSVRRFNEKLEAYARKYGNDT